MNWYLVLQVVLTGALLVLIGFIIAVLSQLRRTLQTCDTLLSNVNQELPAVLLKLQLTLDGVNTELDKVEDIVATFHDVTERVQNATNLVQRAAATPVVRFASLAAGAKTVLANLIGRKKSI